MKRFWLACAAAFALAGGSGAAAEQPDFAFVPNLRGGTVVGDSLDYVSPALRMLRIERVYPSQDAVRGTGWFGYGWGSRYETYLQPQGDGSIVAHDFGVPGARVVFVPEGGALLSKDHIVDQIVRAAIASQRVRDQDDVTAYRQALTKLDGAALEATWTEYYLPRLVEFPARASGTVYYDPSHQQRLVRVPGGYQRSLADAGSAYRPGPGEYDGADEEFNDVGLLTRVFDADHNSVSVRYDSQGYMMSPVPYENRPGEISDNQGDRLTLTWSSSNYYTSAGYTKLLTKVEDGHGRSATYAYEQKSPKCDCSGRYLVSFKNFDGSLYRYDYADNASYAQIALLGKVQDPSGVTIGFHAAEDDASRVRVFTFDETSKGRAATRRLLYLYAGAIGAAPPVEVIETTAVLTTDTLYDAAGASTSRTQVQGPLERLAGKPPAFYDRLGEAFARIGDADDAQREFMLAASAGDGQALGELGLLALPSESATGDEAKALSYFRAGAERDDAVSQAYGALLLAVGAQVAHDPAQVARYLGAAAEQRDLIAKIKATSDDVSAEDAPRYAHIKFKQSVASTIELKVYDDQSTNSRLLTVIASGGSGPGVNEYFAYLYAGDAKSDPIEEVVSVSDGATTDVLYGSAGHVRSQTSVSGGPDRLAGKSPAFDVRLGDVFYEFADDLAFAEYRLAASQGDPDGQADLAVMYQTGRGTEKDPQKAFALAGSAAQHGSVIGETLLGYLYEHGIGVTANCAQAKHYYEVAAAAGSASAKRLLGELKCT